jgi:DNA-binding MarR family transcriptional regulator
MGEVIEFLGVIWTVDHALQTLSKRMLATMGVTGPQRLVLRIVARFPGVPAGEIASVMRLDRSTISGILKRLEGRGLLQRRQDLRDGRRTLVVLTARGRELAADSTGTVEAVVESALAGMSAAEVSAARSALTRLAAALKADEQEAGATARGPSTTARARRASRSLE